MDISWGPGGSAEISYRQERVRRDVAAARGARRVARRSAAGPPALRCERGASRRAGTRSPTPARV